MSVPQRAVDEAADALEKGIDRAAAILGQLAESRPDVVASIAGLLGMSEVLQTYRMAGAIVANAMVFHERLAGLHGVKPLSQLCSTSVANPKSNILEAWTQILKVNYWPIFSIARDIVEQLPAAEASQLLSNLRATVEDVAATGANQAHDLTGRIFQRLIADRKYLATFYTLPASAALLARLAVSKLVPDSDPGMAFDWSDPDAIGKLKIGDFACGTGALLSAVYEQIATRHEISGGNLAALHPVMMEEVLYGCDVMPSAIHITGSTLSGAQPNVGFGRTRLYTLAYGRQEDGSVAIGSLELLQSSSTMTLFNMSDPALRTGSVGEETATQVVADIPDGEFDLVIMNPPFTSDTKHYDAGDGVLNAAFAAFNATEDDQKRMANLLKRLVKGKDSTYHGHAGLASAFVQLCHRKLKPDGVMALVLPLTAINGSSWAKFRRLIATYYTDVSTLSIAANGKDMSFSSDTGIGECLVIARKVPDGAVGELPQRARFTSLRQRPQGFAHAKSVAEKAVDCAPIWRIEDGPFGGTPLTVGDEFAGESLDAPTDNYASGWGAARVLEASVAQVAHSLSTGRLWLPAKSDAPILPVTQLENLGRRGVDHQLLVSAAHNGPFTKAPANPNATFPALYNHSAKAEKFMVCNPDMALHVKPGMEQRALELWGTASRAHINLDFRFTSQPLTAAITDYKTIGGTAWPNVTFTDAGFDYPFALWSNSTLGLLLFWWYASRQQDGRGRTTIVAVESLPVLDFRTLTDDQLSTAESIFDEFRDKDLMPAFLADADPNRALLDRRVICDLLGFDDSVYEAVRRLSAKWCAEPSVHGGKRRPKDAILVI